MWGIYDSLKFAINIITAYYIESNKRLQDGLNFINIINHK